MRSISNSRFLKNNLNYGFNGSRGPKYMNSWFFESNSLTGENNKKKYSYCIENWKRFNYFCGEYMSYNTWWWWNSRDGGRGCCGNMSLQYGLHLHLTALNWTALHCIAPTLLISKLNYSLRRYQCFIFHYSW